MLNYTQNYAQLCILTVSKYIHITKTDQKQWEIDGHFMTYVLARVRTPAVDPPPSLCNHAQCLWNILKITL